MGEADGKIWGQLNLHFHAPQRQFILAANGLALVANKLNLKPGEIVLVGSERAGVHVSIYLTVYMKPEDIEDIQEHCEQWLKEVLEDHLKDDE